MAVARRVRHALCHLPVTRAAPTGPSSPARRGYCTPSPTDFRPRAPCRRVDLPVKNVVVLGASAGGVDALARLVRELPADLDACVLIVLHVSPNAPSNLPRILGRLGPLAVSHAVDGQPLERGHVVVAPPDHHLSIDDGRARVVRGPRENLHRPSVDVLFRSAALAADGRTCGVILSGALDDGVAGMLAIHRLGGITAVQSPDDAIVSGMPTSVLRVMQPDHILPADEIGRRLAGWLGDEQRAPAPGREPADERSRVAQEVGMSRLDPKAMEHEPPGRRSPFGCPDCGGVLWELEHDTELRFRCRVGHAYTARALLAAEETSVEDAMWAALRALEEQEDLSRQLLDRPWARGLESTQARIRDRADTAKRRAEVLRSFLLSPPPTEASQPFDEAEPARPAPVS